jgi:hypothetical protein
LSGSSLFSDISGSPQQDDEAMLDQLDFMMKAAGLIAGILFATAAVIAGAIAVVAVLAYGWDLCRRWKRLPPNDEPHLVLGGGVDGTDVGLG